MEGLEGVRGIVARTLQYVLSLLFRSSLQRNPVPHLFQLFWNTDTLHKKSGRKKSVDVLV